MSGRNLTRIYGWGRTHELDPALDELAAVTTADVQVVAAGAVLDTAYLLEGVAP